MATRNNNALAALSTRLEQIAEVERESAVFHGDPLDVSDDINKASRIILELAKVRSDKDGCPTCFQSIDAIKSCRAIAEEGDVK